MTHPLPGSFQLVAEYEPRGDQPEAIESLVRSLQTPNAYQTLLGVTGSGKTFTIANVVARINKPTLVIAHNKTLAAQLTAEFKEFFPHNAVEYFVSYYDYYQPEAYIPQSDTFIEKDAKINDEIDKLRHSATSALLERNDVLVVASVSSIFGLGNPERYRDNVLSLRVGMERPRNDVLRRLVDMQYERNDVNFTRGTFRVRGDVLEIVPASQGDHAMRVEFFGDDIDRITEVDIVTGEVLGRRDHMAIFPASHFVSSKETIERAVDAIRLELAERLEEFKSAGKLLEAQRLEQRTNYDIEMMQEVGFCSGIENYSRHLDGRKAGEPPFTLFDYFPEDFLLVVDESHRTIPQLHGMYGGDRTRKQTLIEHGFRLPSAADNRPLRFEELGRYRYQSLFVSATPGDYEQQISGEVVEQIIRPTGLVDPLIHVRPIKGQIDDLVAEIRKRTSREERVLVTTLTKKMSEDLTDYFKELGIKVRYLHSDIKTLERMSILRDLRLGVFDVLIGINLLREGLDLPEVSLVAILDADKEGFLRAERSLIQTIGRAARNASGEVIMYADSITRSMDIAISETNRRRQLQTEHNDRMGIVPQTIRKAIRDVIEATKALEDVDVETKLKKMTKAERKDLVVQLEKEMKDAARALQFERAAELRDLIIELSAS